jgi:fructose-bisphosphate aldolase / 2-amino-3,7-dideoxy-D-threo-hept-6-ulosonate synthase
VSLACRIGAELGADFIKTRYPGDEGAFRRTVAGCGKPILVAGGPLRDPDLISTLRLADDAMRAGAAGVVFGRTIWQHSDPAGALRAVCSIVHEDASIEEALAVSAES